MLHKKHTPHTQNINIIMKGNTTMVLFDAFMAAGANMLVVGGLLFTPVFFFIYWFLRGERKQSHNIAPDNNEYYQTQISARKQQLGR
jgi:hypothetical protein